MRYTLFKDAGRRFLTFDGRVYKAQNNHYIKVEMRYPGGLRFLYDVVILLEKDDLTEAEIRAKYNVVENYD